MEEKEVDEAINNSEDDSIKEKDENLCLKENKQPQNAEEIHVNQEKSGKKKSFKRIIIVILICSISLFLFIYFGNKILTGNAIKTNSENMNVILITIDALRADHLGTYGYERNTSPNIDKFAEESLVFENAYVQWPKTIPSIASIFSSNYPHTTGVMKTEEISQDLVMLPEILQQNGYKTFAAVNNPVLNEEFNVNQGFDNYTLINKEITDFYQLSDAQELTEQTINWLNKNKNKKFFAWLHYMDPHAPYNSVIGDKEHDLFIEDEYYNKINTHMPIGNWATIGSIPNSAAINDITRLDYYIAEYDAEIHYSDAWVGKLLNYLEKTGLKENTLIIISADHGESLTDHGYLFSHGNFIFDASLHVPLIMYYPQEINKSRIETNVPLIDLSPTILDLLNIDKTDTMKGHSLLPLIYEGKNQNDFVFSEGRDVTDEEDKNRTFFMSIRNNEGYKLIRYHWKLEINNETHIARFKTYELSYAQTNGNEVTILKREVPSYELYHISNDPHEINNLLPLNEIEFANLAGYLDQQIDEWYNSEEKFVYSTKTPEISDEKLELIKSLGYMN